MSIANTSNQFLQRRPAALSPDQAAEVIQVGERLLAELRPLFRALPANAQSGLGLARHLNVDRGTATRFASICGKSPESIEIVARAPGPKGLRQILEAMRRRGLAKAHLATASSAVDRVERLLHELGMSQTRLASRLAATRASAGSPDPQRLERVHRDRRAQLFESAADLLGHRMDTWIVAHVFRPSGQREGLMDQAMMRGTVGYRARRDAPAFALRSFGKNDDSPALRGESAGARPYQPLGAQSTGEVPDETVFREFSSDPLPLVTVRGTGKDTLVVVDSEHTDEEAGIDFVLGHVLLDAWGLPSLDTPPTHEVSTYVSVPCARMIFDTFLHRSMARQCVPRPRLYRTTPGVFNDRSQHWHDMLPYPPAIRLLGAEPQIAGSVLYPRHAELLAAFFGRMGWNMGDFVGYRVEVEFPVWCGYYCNVFDYSPEGVPD